MKVSVIIPIYNVELYIRECVQSVINQTLKEIEIILVNDGTKDRSIEKIQDLIDLYDNVHLISQSNKGLSAARNKGLLYAKGEYICFIDSDDYVQEGFIEALYSEAKRDDLDIVFGGYSKVYEKSKILPQSRNNNLLELGVTDGLTYLEQQLIVDDYRMEVWDDLYKRKFLLDNNLQFYEKILHEDEEFTPRCLLYATRVKLINNVQYMYRQRENSIMSTKVNDKNIKSFYTIINNFNDRFNKSDNFKEKSALKHLLDYLLERYSNQLIDISDFPDKRLLTPYKQYNINEILKDNIRVTLKKRVRYYILRLSPTISFRVLRWKKRIYLKYTL